MLNHEMLITGDRLPKAEALARARQLGIPSAFLTEDIPARDALLLSLTFERWPDLIPLTPPTSLARVTRLNRAERHQAVPHGWADGLDRATLRNDRLLLRPKGVAPK